MRKLVFATLLILWIGFVVASLAAEGGNSVSVTGTPEDSYCWSSMGAHGLSHKECAMKCVRAGAPVSFVEKGTGKVYILLPPKDQHPLPPGVVDRMEEEVTITGKLYTKGGVSYLTVESIK